MAYFKKNKTRRIIGDCYYWPKMVIDINCYIQNCNNCCRFIIPWDKTLGLLKPLLIPNCLWQYIFIDFYELPPDCNGYDIVIILIDCFSKYLFLIPCYKNIDAKKAVWLYIYYIYWIYGLLDTIVFDYGPQFILVFWNKFT